MQVPGLTNLWVPPIRNRLDMLATGIKAPSASLAGGDLATLDRVAAAVEAAARGVPGGIGPRPSASSVDAMSTSPSTEPPPRAHGLDPLPCGTSSPR